MPYTYEYPRPAVTVDAVVFGLDQESRLNLLLIQRDAPPYTGKWALPGGFVEMDEDLETGVLRELQEETGLRDVFLEQLYTFGAVDRDPRARTITIAYYALINLTEYSIQAASDARDAKWFLTKELPELAFDHDLIVEMALKRLRGKVRYEPIGFELLPEKFTLSQLQKLYETIFEQRIDKRNFRRKILGMGLLKALNEYATGVPHRAPRFYQFDEEKYIQLKERGFNFEI